MTHHDIARTIPAGFTDHDDNNLNVKVAMPAEWTVGHEGNSLVGESPKSLVAGRWAFVSIYRKKDGGSLADIMRSPLPPDPKERLLDSPVTVRVAIPAGDSVRSSWHYQLTSSSTSGSTWIAFYFIADGGYIYVMTLSGDTPSESFFSSQIGEIVKSLRILP